MIVYTAHMPMGRDRKIVHLTSKDRNVYYRFVSIERGMSGAVSIPRNNEHRIFLTCSSLDEGSIRGQLAQINMCGVDEISIVYEHMAQWKIDLLHRLQEEGILYELTPGPSGWHYAVVHPDKLPECLHLEFLENGEIRW